MKKSFGTRTLVFVTPVWVIGTYDKEGRANAATVAWGGVCSSKPPSVVIALRKSRYTFENLVERKAFTVNVPSAAQVKIADYFGMVSGRQEDKIAHAGVTVRKSEIVDAPYILEFPMVLECKVTHMAEVGIHTHFVGEILDVKVEETLLDENGLPDIFRISPIIYGPELQGYYGLGEYLGRAFSIGKAIEQSTKK